MTVATAGAAASGPAGPSVLIAGRRFPVLLPRLSDPRMHVAAVIVTVQVLGQVTLGFDVSIAQILLCLGTCAVIEIPMTLWEKGVLAWPASALLTGNGTAVILRAPGTLHGDWWSLEGWPVFVAAAAVGVLAKYAIRVRDRHVFNPSNLGLVVVFLLFGSRYADPQDLWWGPWDAGLVVALAVILVGGLTLARRLGLFSIALWFWATFAAGVGVVAASGHAITTRWSVAPVSGWGYWQVFVTSPEIVIFVFFMITDPRTAPASPRARRAYAIGVGILAATFAAPQTTEFATKVSLLAALTLGCAAVPWLERLLPPGNVVADGEPVGGIWRRRSVLDQVPRVLRAPAVVGVAALVLVVAGTPARTVTGASVVTVAPAGAGRRPAVELAAGAVPDVVVAPAVASVAVGIDADEAQRMGRDVVAGLAIEGRAIREHDADLAATATYGDRLAATTAAIEDGRRRGASVEARYDVDELVVVLLRDPVSPQARPVFGLQVRGTRTDVSFDQTGRSGPSSSVPYDQVLMVARGDGHWLIGRQLDLDDEMVHRS